jgi:hypothetical protein
MDASLVDWDMRSDRNIFHFLARGHESLVDWDMRSDRNAALRVNEKYRASSRLGYH